jgi:hypothetical protein
MTDTSLWEVFKVDFKAFTTIVLGRADPVSLQKLRSYLQRGGVFVPSTIRYETEELDGTGTDAVTTLREVIKEKVKYIWTEEDAFSIRESLEGDKPVFSRTLQRLGLLKQLDVT